MMYKITKQEKVPGSIVEFHIEIESTLLEKKWPEAVKHLNEHLDMPGFRKGHIPEKVLVQKIGEMGVLEEAAELAIQEIYPDIIEKSDIAAIGHPKIVITKIARGNPLEFIARVAVIPEIKLGDYKKISKKIMSVKEEVSVEEKEIEDVINEIKKHRKSTENKDEEITDAFVQTLGDFKDVADFRAKLKENITKEKEFKGREKKRLEVLEAIKKDSEIDVPEVLIENELQRMVGEFSHELSKMGSTFEKYLGEIKKTEDDVKKEWTDKAKGRVMSELILMEIAKKEKIEPKKQDIENEAMHLIQHYPDTPKERIMAFMEEVMTKEEVFKFLEKQA